MVHGKARQKLFSTMNQIHSTFRQFVNHRSTDKGNGIGWANCSIKMKTYAVIPFRLGYEVAGSILDGITGIFHWLNPSLRITMVRRSTRPLKEMSTKDIFSELKTSGAYG
jgi:hypothetical protein